MQVKQQRRDVRDPVRICSWQKWVKPWKGTVKQKGDEMRGLENKTRLIGNNCLNIQTDTKPSWDNKSWRYAIGKDNKTILAAWMAAQPCDLKGDLLSSLRLQQTAGGSVGAGRAAFFYVCVSHFLNAPQSVCSGLYWKRSIKFWSYDYRTICLFKSVNIYLFFPCWDVRRLCLYLFHLIEMAVLSATTAFFTCNWFFTFSLSLHEAK